MILCLRWLPGRHLLRCGAVASWDPATGQTVPATVEQVFVHHDVPTLRLTTTSGMAGIKQNDILGQPLRDSWLASAEHLV
ncbi:hypothetical protein [Actinomyces israelii]|uniref:hypothetical protein n=1 Tax=Actinomyces israelii TaxID=1659 RepID=UPI002555C4BB|nr:hypothetical protein [Actinomyces israelii]WKR22387.1 hypothetical protein AIF0345_2336 [Actinomyces israelii]